VFATDRGGNYELWTIELATKKLKQLTRAGTDAPIIPSGFSLQLEWQMFVRADFTPAEVIRAARWWSAEAVGNDLGSIKRGKLADLVIVAGDPLQNIADTLNVTVTIKNGKAYAINELLTQPR
jgi:imidazolonepropionase-like amidohydrolase